MTSWHKDGDEWVVKVEGGDFPEHMVGSSRTVTARNGKKTQVLLTEHIRGWMAAGGRHVDLYRASEIRQNERPESSVA